MELTADLRGRVDDLFCDYAYCIDDDNPEIWPDFFTDDGLYEVTTKEADQRKLPMAIMRCKGMGQIRDRSACPVLTAVLSDERDDAMVRHEAAEALGAIGDAGAVCVLEKYARDPVPEVADTCKISLELIK